MNTRDCCTKVNLSLCNSPSFRIGADGETTVTKTYTSTEIGHTNKDDCNARPCSCTLIGFFPTSSYDWYQMPPQRAALYLSVQFEDVVCKCQQNGLTQDIRTPSRKKAAKSKGRLDLCKDFLCLDAAVHPQDDPETAQRA